MTETAFALVDSNVIIDIVQRDLQWLDWSRAALENAVRACVNPIIFAELCYQQSSVQEVDRLLTALDLNFEELPREALFLASRAFREYRRRGGTKTAPLADFFIGAHAVALGVPIITRDVVRYRAYFPTVTLISP